MDIHLDERKLQITNVYISYTHLFIQYILTNDKIAVQNINRWWIVWHSECAPQAQCISHAP